MSLTFTVRSTGTASGNSVTTPSFTPSGGGRLHIYVGAYKNSSTAVTSNVSVTDSLGVTWSTWAENDSPAGTPRLRLAQATRTGYSPENTPMTVTISHADASVTGLVWEITEIKSSTVGILPNVATPGNTNNQASNTSTTGDPVVTLPVAPPTAGAVDCAHITVGSAAMTTPTGFTSLTAGTAWAGSTCMFATVYDETSPPQTCTWSTANGLSVAISTAWTEPVANKDVFEDNSGTSPGGWTPNWVTTGLSGSGWVEGAGGTVTVGVTTAGRHALSWNEINATDIEVLAKCKSDSIGSGNPAMGVVLRGSGAATTETGVRLSMGENGSGSSNLSILTVAAGSSVSVSSPTKTWTTNTYYWIRARAMGTQIRLRTWQDGTTEPSTWDIDTTQTAVPGAGWAGLYTHSVANVTFDYFSYATLNMTAQPMPITTTAAQSLAIAQTATATVGAAATVTATATNSLTIGQTATVTSPINGTATSSLTMGQTATATNASTVSIGGIAIGSAGTGIYSGFKLVWGDDFNSEPLPFNLRPAIAANASGNTGGTWSSVSPQVATRSYGVTEQSFYLDASYRGPRHESQTDLSGADTWSVTGGVISLTSSVRPSSLDSHVSYVQQTGCIDPAYDTQGRPLNVSGQLSSHPQFHLSADGDWVVEFLIQVASGTLNGYWPGAWMTSYNWPDFGEQDIFESWLGSARQNNVSLHISNTDGGGDAANTFVSARALGAAVSRKVQVVLVKSGNSLTYYDDFTTAGTLVSIATYTDATRVGTRIRGAHRIVMQCATDSRLSGGNYSAAHWPQANQIDWVRVWTPSSGPDVTPVSFLPEETTTPGGAWTASFPSAVSMYGFTPDVEEIMALFDNEDNPGYRGRTVVYPVRPGGMTIDAVGRTITGTVPAGDGGRVGLMFIASRITGGPATTIFKLWNVAPAEQPKKVFLNAEVDIGQSFSRTLNYNDFHSGNLGPHTYTVTKSGAGAGDFTITGSGTGTVTISGTVATVGTTTIQIVCTNTKGQTTTITRTITAAARPFRWDFRNNEYRHQSTTYADPAALIAASKMTFALAAPISGTWYAEDLDGNLTIATTANNLRISNKGLAYEPAITNLMASSNSADTRAGSALSNSVTATADLLIGPSGTQTADRLIETATANSHYVGAATGGIAITAGVPYILAAYVKRGTVRYGQIAGTSAAWSTNNKAYITFDMLRGAITETGADVQASGVEMAPFLGKGWWRVWFKATPNTSVASGANGVMIGFCNDSATPGTKQPSYTGDTTHFFYVFQASMVQAASLQVGTSMGTTVEAKPADAMTVVLPTGCNGVRFRFDDGSTQDVTGLSPGSYAVPTNLNRNFITEMVGLSAGAAISATATQSLAMQQIATATNAGAARSASATQSLRMGQSATITTIASTTKISGLVTTLRAEAIVEMFEYDDTNIGGSQVLRWHAGTTASGNPITWQGKTYVPLPIEVSGFALSLNGSLPRPQMKASNIGGQLGGYLRSMDGAVGAKVTRRRTLGRYLDAVNFPGGNPNADASASFPDEIYFLARKTSETPIFIEYELAASFDVAGVQLPRRQVIASTCEWVYRSAECGYAGPPVQDIDGKPTTDPAKDKCRKTLDACKARFGKNGVLNSSAFPGSLLVQS